MSAGGMTKDTILLRVKVMVALRGFGEMGEDPFTDELVAVLSEQPRRDGMRVYQLLDRLTQVGMVARAGRPRENAMRWQLTHIGLDWLEQLDEALRIGCLESGHDIRGSRIATPPSATSGERDNDRGEG